MNCWWVYKPNKEGRMYKRVMLGLMLVAVLPLAASAQLAREPQEGEPQESAQEASDESTSQVTPEATFFIRGRVSNDLNLPDFDVWHVKCTAVTTIRAQVADNDFGDNTFHVTTLCLSPKRG